jgi:hypothetical protein
MSQQEASDSHLSKWLQGNAPLDSDLEIVRLCAARARAMDEAGAAVVRQLNGPLTALLFYMGFIWARSNSTAAGFRKALATAFTRFSRVMTAELSMRDQQTRRFGNRDRATQ